jgi:sensor histidine kinase YesM
MIPPMLIQPFLENAIWHGATPGKELQLKLHFLKLDQQLVCIVDDNGIGIIASEKNKQEVTHNSIGINNVKERIQVLNEKYNLHSSVIIEDKSFILPKNGSGTIVKLFFPLNSIQS